MSSRSSGPVNRQVLVALCLMTAAMIVAVICAATANAAVYKMVLCAANNGSNSFDTQTNSPGLFNVENYCGPAGDPAGNAAFLRIYEKQGRGSASNTAYASASWTATPWVSILAGGGYTRMPGDFRDGWRGRFWAEGVDGSNPHNILMQGTNASNAGISWWPTSTFGSHLWPFPGWGNYRRFVFELTCMRPAGCDTSGWNAVDANTMVLTLSDNWAPQTWLTNSDPALMSGAWVRGTRTASFGWSELGSGIAMERIRIDGADHWVVNHFATSECDIGSSQINREFARAFQPCAVAEGINRSYTFDSANLPDGPHTLQACTQDYAQYVGLYGTGGSSCDQRTILTDNNPPGAPVNLRINSANPARYLHSFTAHWQLPPNQGSPIRAVHYDVIDAAGNIVQPGRVVAATDPIAVSMTGPAKAGNYRLRVWLEDAVGFTSALATVPIPRDAKPPSAPQGLEVVGPTTWGPAKGYRLKWRNLTDDGSPIVITRYQVVDGSGQVVVPTKVLNGQRVESVFDPEITHEPGRVFSVRVWLEDEEGNIGAAAEAKIPGDDTPPGAPQGLSVAAPTTSRAEQGFDLRWRNLTDDGSPVIAARYQITDGAGKVVVPTEVVRGAGIQSIANLRVPTEAGSYRVKLWLEDSEGNAGAPASAPLAYDCVRSDVRGGTSLSAEFVNGSSRGILVDEGKGATLAGELRGAERAGATICVWSRVVTDQGRDFLGLALAGPDGRYRFAVGAGPSREVIAGYRPDQRELRASTTVSTIVHPTLRARKRVVHNGESAHFSGEIPGPHNDAVTIVLQVKSGKGWLAFRRYRTRNNGHYKLVYPFRRTMRPTTYEMRAQVREAGGYPYLEGESESLVLHVLPRRQKVRKHHARCAKKAKKKARSKGRRRCGRKSSEPKASKKSR